MLRAGQEILGFMSTVSEIIDRKGGLVLSVGHGDSVFDAILKVTVILPLFKEFLISLLCDLLFLFRTSQPCVEVKQNGIRPTAS